MNCKHKYVNMEDGTRDKFCVRCSKKFKQAAMHIDPRTEPESQTINPVVNIDVGVYGPDAIEEIQRRVIEGINGSLIRQHTRQ